MSNEPRPKRDTAGQPDPSGVDIYLRRHTQLPGIDEYLRPRGDGGFDVYLRSRYENADDTYLRPASAYETAANQDDPTVWVSPAHKIRAAIRSTIADHDETTFAAFAVALVDGDAGTQEPTWAVLASLASEDYPTPTVQREVRRWLHQFHPSNRDRVPG